MRDLLRATRLTVADQFTWARARLGGAQKSSNSVPAYLRFVNRRLGGWLASCAYAVGLTPTQVTVMSATSSFAGIILLALMPPDFGVGAGVAALLLLGYALDSADGQLARVRGGGSRAGEWLDHVSDIAKISSLHAAVAVSMLRFFDLPALVVGIPLIYQTAHATHFLGMMLRDQLRASAGSPSDDTGSSSVLRAWVLLPLDHGTLGLVFLLLGWPSAFVAGYGALALCTLAFSVHSLSKAYRGLATLDRLGSSR